MTWSKTTCMHINSASYDRNRTIFDIIITRPIAASSFLLGIVEELLTGDDGIRVRNLSGALLENCLLVLVVYYT